MESKRLNQFYLSGNMSSHNQLEKLIFSYKYKTSSRFGTSECKKDSRMNIDKLRYAKQLLICRAQ